jgi:hypothetical protein
MSPERARPRWLGDTVDRVSRIDDFYAICERCGRTTPVLVVDSDEPLTPEEQAASDAYGRWYSRFDPVQHAYLGRCPDCVAPDERQSWIRNDSGEFPDHTAPAFRRRDTA